MYFEKQSSEFGTNDYIYFFQIFEAFGDEVDS